MFSDQAFHSWAVILVGATAFAGLFALLAMMTELLFEGVFQVSRAVVAFGAAAFVGYVGVAVILRRGNAPPES